MLDQTDYDEEKSDTAPLLLMVQKYQWKDALKRIQEFPEECKVVGTLGRTPLHWAVDHDAPEEVIQALTRTYPQACLQVGTTGMNPLHIACSSDHASAESVRVLLMESAKVHMAEQMVSMRDVDQDTPLHSACRCGASIDVMRLLMLVHPDAVNQRDYEGLTPVLRLWVREYVLLGGDAISNVKGPEDLVGELGEAWKKTMLMMYCAYMGSLKPLEGVEPTKKVFRPLHAVAAIDCPRRVIKIATIVYKDQLSVRDENGMTPLLIACQAPVYKFQDIADDGADLEDMLEDHLYADGDDTEMAQEGDDDGSPRTGLPSVIDLLMEAEPSASKIADPTGKLPLQLAKESGKKRSEGIRALTDAEGLEADMENTLKITTAVEAK
eukprot:CAMPEP_0113454082 /NCGR_PEP_ID=MMETSP0014_2-20120614/7683_1 /TAXON_ID=2857 /ORGANISM="Nitzschia sp." /LENGTH=380 /DNA_ID=CAMNT_0000345483 /DNA_START=288 /DNA_END=1430 /DNA_ORIENTATION=+ /assembly_acc=CAM_ASM_000159